MGRKPLVFEECTERWFSHLLWTGSMGQNGYGKWGTRNAHCVVYELFVGPIPPGMEIDHVCRRRACVNPDHLEAVTRFENNRRRDEALGRGKYATHCKHGHEYTESNTFVNTSGARECRVCRTEAQARKRAKRAAAGLATATGKPRRSVRGRPRRVA